MSRSLPTVVLAVALMVAGPSYGLGNAGAAASRAPTCDGNPYSLSACKATGGTAARTLAARFAEVANVKDYGAKGDGTTDDTSAISAALTAATAVFGTVTFPPGTYLVTSGFTVSARVSIVGAGTGDETGAATKAATVLKTATAGVTVFTVASGADHTVIADMALWSTASSGAAPGIIVGGVDGTNGAGHVVLRNLLVKGFKGDGIWVKNGNGGRIDAVRANANGGHGIRLDSANTSFTNANAWVCSNLTALSNTGDGVYVGSAVSNYVWGIDSEGNTGYGIEVLSAYNTIAGYVESNTSGPANIGISAFDNALFLRAVAGTPAVLNGNNWVYWQNGSGLTPTLRPDNGVMSARAAFTTARFTPTYSASISFSAASGNEAVITATNSTAFTINSPTSNNWAGQQLTVRIRNTSGGALGAITMGAAFHLAGAVVAPATGFNRAYTFTSDGTNWLEVSRTAADVAN